MKVVGVTACPTGIAHTYMAQEAIEKECRKRGFEVKVETQGGMGIEQELEQEEIDAADVVILAVAISIEGEERFEEKEEEVQPVFEPQPTFTEPTFSQHEEEKEEELHSITRKHILTLFSHGASYEEIAEQLNVPVSTVQLVIDSYFESGSH